MTMPKTTIYEYSHSMFRQNNIWISWKILPMKSKSITFCVKITSNEDFRLRMFLAHAAHDFAALISVNNIHHVSFFP